MTTIDELKELNMKNLKTVLIEEDSITTWFNTPPRAGGSRATINGSWQSLKKYISFLASNPINLSLTFEDLMVEAETTIGRRGQRGIKASTRVLEFFNWMYEDAPTPVGYSPPSNNIGHDSARKNANTIKALYRDNNCPLIKCMIPAPLDYTPTDRSDAEVSLDTEIRDSETNLLNTRLEQFARKLNYRDRTILLCSYSSGGMDGVDLCKLRIEEVRNQLEKGYANINITTNRQKTKVGIQTFFSEEATSFLKKYLEEERFGADRDDYLDKYNKGKFDREFIFLKDEGGQLNSNAITQAFKEASIKLGHVSNGNGRQSAFRMKRFRKVFTLKCVEARVDREVIKVFQGHKREISGRYSRVVPEQAREILLPLYKEVEPLLKVFKGHSYKVVTEVEKLKEENESLTSRLEEIENRINGGEFLVRQQQASQIRADRDSDEYQQLDQQNLVSSIALLMRRIDDLEEQLRESREIEV